MEIGCCRKVSHDGQSYGTKHILSHQNSLLHVLADGHCSAIFFKGYIKRSFWNKLRLLEKSNNEKDDICWNQPVNGLKALDKFDKAVETSFNSELNNSHFLPFSTMNNAFFYNLEKIYIRYLKTPPKYIYPCHDCIFCDRSRGVIDSLQVLMIKVYMHWTRTERC